ncbi:kinase-like domain-containing protein [Phascolomyces articulosus]|uniref:cAMP-dependent protein kinase n=1 Tax=Phascolomyces articulosus TaxID=60185 RepID=A0AAD5PHE9_9FUNG|nr:kinase-like domain-containing protein [Phascolomyces articulosus]
MRTNKTTTLSLKNDDTLPIEEDHQRGQLIQRRQHALTLHLGDFQLLRTLGTGSFGRVRLCRSIHNHHYYAIKIMNKAELVRLKQMNHTNSERKTLLQVIHPFIVHLWGTFQDTHYLYMVMDFIPGGELFSVLKSEQCLEPHVAQFFAAEALSALAYLHEECHIIYRDLKPENILLDRQGHVRLTDFGFAKYVSDRTYTFCGTADYLAPEIIMLIGYGKTVDYWALGILIFEMLAGYTPFHDDDPLTGYDKILVCNIKYPLHFSTLAHDLLARLLTRDLSQRLGNLAGGYQDIMDHPWFADMDFELLAQREITPPYQPQILDGNNGQDPSSCYEIYDEEPLLPSLENDVDPYRHYFMDF